MTPPRDERELIERASGIAGRTLGRIAADLDIEPPMDLRRAKGWVG